MPVTYPLTSLVLVTTPDTQKELETFFTETELERVPFWSLTSPSLDLYNYIIFETIFNPQEFIGQYLYSITTGVTGRVISIETINNKLVALIYYNTVAMFNKKEILSLLVSEETKEIKYEYALFVLETKTKKPIQKIINPSVLLLQKTLKDKKHKKYNLSFNPDKPKNRDPADLLLTEIDYRTAARKSWYFQVDRLPVSGNAIQVNDNEETIIFHTNEGNYSVSREVPGIEIK